VAELPPAVVTRLQRLASFPNPEYFKRQRLRLSTWMVPRVVDCSRLEERHLLLPRGALEQVRKLVTQGEGRLALEDARTDADPIPARFAGQLTPAQATAVEALAAHETGVLVAPPGTGKTVMGIALLAARGRATLILVHRRPLLEQWLAQLGVFLEEEESPTVGRMGGGAWMPSGQVDVAMLQTLVRRDDLAEVLAGYGHVIVDECHHVPAASFGQVLGLAPARYVLGLTATPERRDGLEPILHLQCGPVRYTFPSRGQTGTPFRHRLVVRPTTFRLDQPEDNVIVLRRRLAEDPARNELIIDDVIAALEEGRSPLVLTERRDHLALLAQELGRSVTNLVVLHGGMGVGERREKDEQLAAIGPDEERLVLATGGYIGEGFDDARFDTLFLALPVAWKGTLMQYAGRLHRRAAGKREVRIHDYVDGEVPVLLRMFNRRVKAFQAMGYGAPEPPGPPHQPELDLDSGS
jgi:superfamily II DNA or RNA helicase